MYYSVKQGDEFYTLVAIKVHISKYIYSGHYSCDKLDYKLGKRCNCDDEKITNYSGYPQNVYDNVSNENRKKECFILWVDQIVL